MKKIVRMFAAKLFDVELGSAGTAGVRPASESSARVARRIGRSLSSSIQITICCALVLSSFYLANASFAENVTAKSLEKVRAMVEHKQTAKALEELKPLIYANPQDGLLRYYEAVCLHYLGRTQEAVDGYAKAGELSDDPVIKKRCQESLANFARMGLTARKTAEPASTGKASASDSGFYLPQGIKVVYFYNAACKTCKAYSPVFSTVKEKYCDRPEFIALDLNAPQNKRLVDDYQTEFYPTTIVLNSDNREVGRCEGALDIAELEKFVNHKLEKCVKKR